MASVSLLKSSLVVDKYEWAKFQPHRLPSATAFRCNSFADAVVKNMGLQGRGYRSKRGSLLIARQKLIIRVSTSEKKATRRESIMLTLMASMSALGLQLAATPPLVVAKELWGTHSFIKERFFQEGLSPEEAVARIKQTTEGLHAMRPMLETMSWRYVIFYIRLKSAYLSSDLNNALRTLPESPRRTSYVKTANELVDNMAELDYYVRTPKVYESYLYYERTLKSLDDLNRSYRSKRGSLLKTTALPHWPLLAVLVEHVQGQRDFITEKTVWHLNDQTIKNVYTMYIMFTCWGCCFFGSTKDPFYDGEQYRKDGGDGTGNWVYEKQEDIEERARAELWREELIEEIEQKVGGLRELEEAGSKRD
ncbi:photosynthetic NDH subunit of subcomplex B 4, chloroplastic-like protein [Cinnamomum micranthum f. kanehirae]|uniref:Photosynthetic NDH subunit of subcomplex B 4, chloroplastic-like protein n=1 Tax=Cinnamomum micranthum f. kanehirae TaxID=337451 RepID=A0A3S3NF12_9MAGN|nr:photosynthetic NDH subunit of subcomplex B 4, chloroplastic-like protein [Cinnamomum micranthum f. kanehirae]